MNRSLHHWWNKALSLLKPPSKSIFPTVSGNTTSDIFSFMTIPILIFSESSIIRYSILPLWIPALLRTYVQLMLLLEGRITLHVIIELMSSLPLLVTYSWLPSRWSAMSHMYFSALWTTCCKCAKTEPTLSTCSAFCISPKRSMNSNGREDMSCDKKYSLFWAWKTNEGTRFTTFLPNVVRPKNRQSPFLLILRCVNASGVLKFPEE